MKIEKLTENKIRVIINSEDLKNNNLDYQTIMEKPIESQKLFLEMLLKAEKEVGFYTEGCKLLVEAFSSSDENFVFTITKYVEKPVTPPNKLKVTPKKKIKNVNPKSTTSIYAFPNFEEFCDFCSAIHNTGKIHSKQLAKNISEYLRPIREKRKYYEENPELVDKILKEGTERARKTAQETMQKVKKAMKLDYFEE